MLLSGVRGSGLSAAGRGSEPAGGGRARVEGGLLMGSRHTMEKVAVAVAVLLVLAALLGCDSTPNCPRSWDCQEHGFCTLQGNRCVVGSDEDCRRSNACAVHGKCVARDGECVVD